MTAHNPLSSEVELRQRIHKFVCTMLDLDDEDHENDEITNPIEQALLKLIEAEKVKELERLKLKCWRQDTQMGDNPDTFAAVVFVDEIRARIKELKNDAIL